MAASFSTNAASAEEQTPVWTVLEFPMVMPKRTAVMCAMVRIRVWAVIMCHAAATSTIVVECAAEGTGVTVFPILRRCMINAGCVEGLMHAWTALEHRLGR